MLAKRATGRTLRSLSVAAVPAMASCFILARPVVSFSPAAHLGVAWLRNPSMAGRSASLGGSKAQLRTLRTTAVLMSSAPPGGDTVVAGMEKKLTAGAYPLLRTNLVPALVLGTTPSGQRFRTGTTVTGLI